MKTDLDLTDWQLLALLQHDSRLSIKEIADKLGKSATPILLRKKKLEELGYIKKYMAIVDRQKIDLSLVAFTTVQMKEHSKAVLAGFEKTIVKFHEVMECNRMTGTYDYLLKIVVADMGAYHQFIIDKLSALPNIGMVQSSFVMTEVKRELAYKRSL